MVIVIIVMISVIMLIILVVIVIIISFLQINAPLSFIVMNDICPPSLTFILTNLFSPQIATLTLETSHYFFLFLLYETAKRCVIKNNTLIITNNHITIGLSCWGNSCVIIHKRDLCREKLVIYFSQR